MEIKFGKLLCFNVRIVNKCHMHHYSASASATSNLCKLFTLYSLWNITVESKPTIDNQTRAARTKSNEPDRMVTTGKLNNKPGTDFNIHTQRSYRYHKTQTDCRKSSDSTPTNSNPHQTETIAHTPPICRLRGFVTIQNWHVVSVIGSSSHMLCHTFSDTFCIIDMAISRPNHFGICVQLLPSIGWYIYCSAYSLVTKHDVTLYHLAILIWKANDWPLMCCQIDW